MTFNANDYQTEIDKINGKIEEFQLTEQRVDESFLEVGNILVSIKNKKQLDDKIFRQLKKEVAKTISIRNINKVVAIAQCDVIQRNKERLPKSWSSLYLLSRMENLEELIESKKITPTTTRKEIIGSPKEPQFKKRISVALISKEAITEEHIAELEAILSDKSWHIVK